MAAGTGEWFTEAKVYGFIAPEGGAKDVFVHRSNIAGSGFQTLTEDAEVEFEVCEGEEGHEAIGVVEAIKLAGTGV